VAAKLSHLSKGGEARMVDVSAKPETRRMARAQAFVRIRPSVLGQLQGQPASCVRSVREADHASGRYGYAGPQPVVRTTVPRGLSQVMVPVEVICGSEGDPICITMTDEQS